jgi:hypothetical protein
MGAQITHPGRDVTVERLYDGCDIFISVNKGGHDLTTLIIDKLLQY